MNERPTAHLAQDGGLMRLQRWVRELGLRRDTCAMCGDEVKNNDPDDTEGRLVCAMCALKVEQKMTNHLRKAIKADKARKEARQARHRRS